MSLPSLTPVEIVPVEGTKVRKPALDWECSRLVGILSRLGKRLSWQQRVTDVSTLPSEQWTRNLNAYAQWVVKLLGEQRERSKLIKGNNPMSDDEYQKAVQKLAEQIVLGLSDAEFERLSAKRKEPGLLAAAGDDA